MSRAETGTSRSRPTPGAAEPGCQHNHLFYRLAPPKAPLVRRIRQARELPMTGPELLEHAAGVVSQRRREYGEHGRALAALTDMEAVIRSARGAHLAHRRKLRDPLHPAERCLIWELDGER